MARTIKYRGYPADLSIVATDDFEQRELVRNRFRRLFSELMKGEILRNSFLPWEIDILLDFEACELPSRRRLEILRQYQRAVERQLETDQGPPMLLSHFLVLRERRRVASSATEVVTE
ncbi:MAG: hypothetical protein JWP63_6938 [Candidatus Solibacter sp.]|nr:hypothetical protein [Candidatus Solibacter sp.]